VGDAVTGAGRSVGSGGRYDNLTATFGKAEPAVGFVLDVDSLADALRSRGLQAVPERSGQATDRFAERLRNAIKESVDPE